MSVRGAGAFAGAVYTPLLLIVPRSMPLGPITDQVIVPVTPGAVKFLVFPVSTTASCGTGVIVGKVDVGLNEEVTC